MPYIALDGRKGFTRNFHTVNFIAQYPIYGASVNARSLKWADIVGASSRSRANNNGREYVVHPNAFHEGGGCPPSR